jgi:EAL domain-containing protein (putative c-di-GMP-specific phosphodiesterase class I)
MQKEAVSGQPCIATATPIDIEEALHSGWLELWYQPKIDVRTHAIVGAEALARIRHPEWGIVLPGYFVSDDGDPHSRALSQFVIQKVASDWQQYVVESGPIELSINLPIAFLRDFEMVKFLCEQMPSHPSFGGLIVEINGASVVRHLDLMKDVAQALRFRKIGLSVDDLGSEWPLLLQIRDFPFIELKVDRKFVTGCADDSLKRTMCRRILALADCYGARTVAEGVETRADYVTARDLGFDVVQGFLFARPMTARKLARRL